MVNCPEKLESVSVITVSTHPENVGIVCAANDQLQRDHILLDAKSKMTCTSNTMEIPTPLALDAHTTLAARLGQNYKDDYEISCVYKLYTDLDAEYVESAKQQIADRDAHILETAPDTNMHLLHAMRDAYVCPHCPGAAQDLLSTEDSHEALHHSLHEDEFLA